MKKLSIVLLILFTMGIFLACDDSDESSAVYSFHVYSTVDSFSGIYNIDGKSDKTFTHTKEKDGFFIFGKDLDENPSSIRITVVGKTNTDYIRVEVYENDTIVESKEDDQAETGDIVSFTLTYNFTNDDSEEE